MSPAQVLARLITPVPRQIVRTGQDLAVAGRPVVVLTGPTADQPALDSIRASFVEAGATDVSVSDLSSAGAASEPAGSGMAESGTAVTVVLGRLDELGDRLRSLGVQPPAGLPAQGYLLAANATRSTIVLAGADADGEFYAAQSLAQLLAGPAVAGVTVVDYPGIATRGAIEGFYGPPWSWPDRLDQVDFYARLKLNAYIYAPKGDPLERDRWRDPYPADDLAQFGTLARAAAQRHVRFTYALSPGLSICFTGSADMAAVAAKFESLYQAGLRGFAIALDDVPENRWNCNSDLTEYGRPSPLTVARAQVDFLNGLEAGFVANHAGVQPLVMVPTEYGATSDSPYLSALRSWNGGLAPAISIMWTGSGVLPATIGAAEAEKAASGSVYGRKVFVWDNYPVNDFAAAAGHLLMAPYQGREAALAQSLTGLVSNPMNQAGASKVALFTVADYAWNPSAYDPDRSWQQAALFLAGGDAQTARDLLVFWDLNYEAPSFLPQPRTPQSPALAALAREFSDEWSAGDAQSQRAAIELLRTYATEMADGPTLIRRHVKDSIFLSDCGPWLDATALLGQAFEARLAELSARLAGDGATAASAKSQADALIVRAAAIQNDPGKNNWRGAVVLGNGVLDQLLAQLDQLEPGSSGASTGPGRPAAALLARLPASIQGVAVRATPMSWDTFMTIKGDPALDQGRKAWLTALGADPSKVLVVVANYDPPVGLELVAIEVPGASAARMSAAMTGALSSAGAPISNRQLGGKTVMVAQAPLAGEVYLYVHDDVLYFLRGGSPAGIQEAFSKLP